MAGEGDARAALGRLRWRCRRGTRELDELLTGYLQRRYPGAPPAEQAAFAALLEASDEDINDWCLGRRAPPDGESAALIRSITTRAANGA